MIHRLRRAALKLPPPLKKIFKVVDYQGRLMTKQWRGLPTFLLIGAQKSGTTSLYEYLAEHPSVVPARTKEVNFFDTHFVEGVNWYKAQFPLGIQAQFMHNIWPRYFHTGEASTYYLFHPDVPERVYRLVPQVKLIAILRNPIDRAYSHFHHEQRHGTEPFSFAEALACEEERLAAAHENPRPFDGPIYRQYSYKTGGRYAEQLERWLRFFPREQILILQSEEMFADMPTTLAKVADFLELPRWQPRSLKPFNLGRYQSDMPPELRQQLEAYFAPYNKALYHQIGVDFSW